MNSQLYAHLEAFDVDDDENDNASKEHWGSDGDDNDSFPPLVANASNLREKHPTDPSVVGMIPIVVFLLLSLIQDRAHSSLVAMGVLCFAWTRTRQEPCTVDPKPHIRTNHDNKTRKAYYECRKTVSRLLGSIGAPPLRRTSDDQWQELTSDMATSTESVVDFLEAHVRLMVTIDRALEWVRISAGLHWGLGPHSRCVERVERAALSRQRITASSCSILVLSLARRNIAKVIIQESQCLVDAFATAKQLHRDEDDDTLRNAVLVVPEVIDLSWMKASRNHLADLLTCVVEQLCTWESLSSERHAANSLKDHAWTARSLRDYMASYLLLDDDDKMDEGEESRAVRPTNDEHGLIVQYRQHLDALSAALWSFQLEQPHHAYNLSESSSPASDEPDLENISNRTLAWWNRIQELSATCQTLQEQIGNRFFPPAVVPDPEDDDNNANDDADGLNTNRPGEEPHSYESSVSVYKEKTKHSTSSNSTTKTLVFSGKGTKPKPTALAVSSYKPKFDGGEVTLPRDFFSEQLLVRELQTRIRAVAALREEEPCEDPTTPPNAADGIITESDTDNNGDILHVSAPLDNVGAIDCTSNKEHSGEEDTTTPCHTATTITSGTKHRMPERKREAAASIFLGASGSLLDELKQSIGSSPNLIMDADNAGDSPSSEDLFIGTEKNEPINPMATLCVPKDFQN